MKAIMHLAFNNFFCPNFSLRFDPKEVESKVKNQALEGIRILEEFCFAIHIYLLRKRSNYDIKFHLLKSEVRF